MEEGVIGQDAEHMETLAPLLDPSVEQNICCMLYNGVLSAREGVSQPLHELLDTEPM